MVDSMTREEKIAALDECCHFYGRCDSCELRKKYDVKTDKYTDDYGCVFDDMDDEMLEKCYNWLKELVPADCENVEAECCEVETDMDMVNHPKNIIEEMRHLFDLFDDNVEIFINKFNKTVDIHIQM